jgi:hypothetical protein
MVKKNSIKLFGDDKIRAIWDDEQEKWYFSIVDVIAVLTLCLAISHLFVGSSTI